MTEWVVSTMESLGYWGVALLMLLENVVPPIPSEVVMPFAGFTAGQGRLSLWGAIAAGSGGSLLGAILWYGIGWAIGPERLKHGVDRWGRRLGIYTRDVEKAERWFDRHGAWAVLLGRVVPGIRTLISVPAGLARMHFVPFVLYSLVGTVAWTALLACLGWAMGSQWETVERYVGWVGIGVAVVVVVVAIVWLWRHNRAAPRPDPSDTQP